MELRINVPCGHGYAQKTGRRNTSDNQIRWQLHEDVSNKENACCQVEIGAFHVQVFLQ